MRGVGSDVAARAIIASCRNQFPTTAPVETRQGESVEAQAAPGPSRSLTSGELQNLKSSAFILADSYRVTIQNQNEHVTVTEVTVAVWNASKPDVRRSYTRCGSRPAQRFDVERWLGIPVEHRCRDW
jgi:hypothetical protein